ncbi:unnamed protein product [Toxocara canis]|uniref:Ribosome biogenesis protein BRX1 homolog n=1 Tax=Toxocara canis TaxID=6265 RepID=A0A183UKT0_TOXCA|nr:unnamed protein product [Toxocara canis]
MLEVTSKWKNRERVLVFCSRGSSFRVRHLMNDFKRLMPHSRGESKLDKQTRLPVINEIAEMANCTKCLYFENRKQKDLYLWISNIVDGPSVKFLVHNVHTMDELRMSGNCLKASRPIMSFDGNFEAQPHLNLIKHLIAQTFATPDHHPRSQPFIDHVFSFSLTPDNKIWFRNFQIVDESLQLQEIGPRMVLELVRIFEGSFEGAVLYDNPDYVGPNVLRRQMKKLTADKYSIKQDVKKMFRLDRSLGATCSTVSGILLKLWIICNEVIRNPERTEQMNLIKLVFNFFIIDRRKGQKERRAAIDAVPLPDPVGEVFDTERKVNDPEAKQLQRTIERKRRKVKKKKNMQNKSADMST